MAKKPSKPKSKQTKVVAMVVKPLVVDDTKKHTLAKLFEGNPKNLPVLKSIGFGRVEEYGNWISYVITSQGKEILSIEVSDPDQRGIAEDNAKTAFVTELMDQGL